MIPDELSALADRLNEYEATVSRGKDPTIEFAPQNDGLFNEDGTIKDPGFAKVLEELDAGLYVGYYDDHPYGRDAGVCAWIEYKGQRAWYDENGDCCWKD